MNFKLVLFLLIFNFIWQTINAEDLNSTIEGASLLQIKHRVVNYDLHIELNFKDGSISVVGKLDIKKNEEGMSDTISLLLHRLLRVNSVLNSVGQKVEFDQNVVSYVDWPELQVNQLRIFEDQGICKGDCVQYSISYKGTICGYAETGMLYVKETINPEFTILRPDAFAYPVIGVPSYSENRKLGLPKFNYTVQVLVPDSLDVVMAGNLLSRNSINGKSAYVFDNIDTAWRMDIIIGKYRLIEDQIRLYHLTEDTLGARTVMHYSKIALELYSDWWGEITETDHFKIIELPSGFGSQAGSTFILQSADAFRDTSQMRQVYHELSHLWNIDPIAPSNRWNEGLATFIEYLSLDVIHGDSILNYTVDWYWKHIKKVTLSDSIYSEIPFKQYWMAQLTGHSYSLGMVFFYLIYQKIGLERFNEMIREIRSEYYGRQISDDAFMQELINHSNGDINEIVQDWYFTLEYLKFINLDYSIDQIINYYK